MRRRCKVKRIGVVIWATLLAFSLIFAVVRYKETRGSIGLYDSLATKSLNGVDVDHFFKLQELNRNIADTLKCNNEEDSMIIMVSSAPKNQMARNAIRKSWGENLPSAWSLIFFLGQSEDQNIQDEVKKEADEHEDIAFGYFVESYKNLTLKTLSMLNWVKTACSSPRYLLKVDDDNFINMKKMINLIDCLNFAENNMYRSTGIVKSYLPKVNKESFKVNRDSLSLNYLSSVNTENMSKKCQPWNPFELISYFISSQDNNYESYVAAGYVYKEVSPDRNPNSKWYLPTAVYPSQTLPDFLSGTSYLLSTKLISHLLSESTKTPLIHLEDVYLTGLLGSKSLKLRLSHINGWSNFRPRWDSACVYHNLITAHGLTASEILNMNLAVNSLNFESDCQGLTTRFSTFLNNQISYYFPRYKM